jgi:hypothetical protein
VRGGYLIFVEEDKASHTFTFTVVDMPLPAHLDQTIDRSPATSSTLPYW